MESQHPTVKDWAERITASWQKQLGSILETGRLLIQAKGSLEHGNWLKMIKQGLPFKERMAQRLMAIARDPNLTNTAHGPYLPPCWRTLYVLAGLSTSEFKRAIQDRIITPEMERSDAEALQQLDKPACNTSKRTDLIEACEARDLFIQKAKKLSKNFQNKSVSIVQRAFSTPPRKQLQEKLRKRIVANQVEISLAENIIALRTGRPRNEDLLH